MNKNYLQKEILETSYDRTKWIKVLKEWFGVKLINQIPNPISRNTNDWSDYVEKACELGRLYTDGGEREIGIFEIELSQYPKIALNRVKLRNLLSNIFSHVDGALIVFTQGNKWRFTYVSEIRERDADDKVISIKTEPKRYTYFFGAGENCRTAANRFDKLKDKPLNLIDLTEAFSVEKLSREFFRTYKEHFEKFWKFLASDKNYYDLFIDREKDEEEKKTKPLRDFVKILLGRLVFLQFLQKKGWMGVPVSRGDYKGGDLNFNQNLFARFADKNYFHSTALRTLFFETLNKKRQDDRADDSLGINIKIPYLNGGLFDKDVSAEHAIDFPAEYFRDLLDFFEQYNFTIDESDAFDREVGIDPEMLGHIFENLLEENREKGAFYTPKEIVHFMCQESLIQYLSNNLTEQDRNDVELLVRHNLVSEALQNDFKRAGKINELLKALKICDPAIGSGAFPMGLLKEIFECRRLLFAPARLENFNAADIKKEIIQNNIYGVDIEPGAVDIARLRFWLSLVVDEEEPQSLPNLDYKIMQGNSLLERFGEIDLKFDKSKLAADYEPERNLFGDYKNPQISFNDLLRDTKQFDEDSDISTLEERFFNTDSPAEKNEIRKKIERIETQCINEALKSRQQEVSSNITYRKTEIERKAKTFASEEQQNNFRQKEYSRRGKNSPSLKELELNLKNIERDKDRLTKMKPGDKPYFLWHLYFLEVFDKEKASESGFDIFIGNPPYIQLQKLGLETDEYEKAGFETFTRTGDIYCLFYELGAKLLKPRGTLCFITSNKWMRAGYGESIRKYFSEKTNPILLIDFAGQKIFDAATVDTNILLFSNEKNQQKTFACVVKEKVLNNLSLFIRQNAKFSGFMTSESWVVLTSIEQRIKEKIEHNGTPLKDWDIQINYGIKTGLNEAFIIDGRKRKELMDQDPKSEEVIRPILRGRDIKRYSHDFADLWLLFIPWHFPLHNDPAIKGSSQKAESAFKAQYPVVYNHLLQYKTELSNRNKAETGIRYEWYALQRWGANYWEDFSKQKIVWGNLNLTATYCIAEPGMFISAPCPMIVPADKYLLAVLNSKLADYFIRRLGVTRNGGYFEYKPMFIEQLPVPLNVDAALSELIIDYCEIIQKRRATRLNYQEIDAELNRIIYNLYGLDEEEINFIESTNSDSSTDKPNNL